MRRLVLITIAVLLLTGLAYGQINVTYRANVSTIVGEGITDSTHALQVCGAEIGPVGQDRWSNLFTTWGFDSPLMTNVDGDYWELTIAYPDTMAGYRMAYKIRYKSNAADDFTWENFTADENRFWTMPASDTTLDIAYVDNNWDPPYTETDSIDVYFRIDLRGHESFNPASDMVYMVGAFPGPDGSANMWDPAKYPLTPETGANLMWGIDLKLDAAGAPYDSMMYRFTLGDWGVSENVQGHGMFPTNENRGVSVSMDTTVAWKWWSDVPPIIVNHEDTLMVTWNADMSKAIAGQGFSFGDTLEVSHGYFGTASGVRTVMLQRQGLSTIYAATDTVIGTIGTALDYQYYLTKNGNSYREIYYNFYYAGFVTGEAERRIQLNIDDGVTIEDVLDSQSEIHRMPIFRNISTIDMDVLVNFECDLRPAYYQVMAGSTLDDIQGNLDVTDPAEVIALGVAMNGPASGNWDSWGAGLMETDMHRMFDDGTHGDVTAGDTVFTMQVQTVKDSTIVGQEFKFGIGGGDNEGGYGNNHIENIDDAAATFTIFNQFGSIDPAFYSAWNFDMNTDVEDIASQPHTFSLDQNYPNPFNPETRISYSLAKAVTVNISVYNMLGQRIATLVDGKKLAGSHAVTWRGLDDRGLQVSSGVYIYRIEAGDFNATHKMLLMK